MKKTIYRTSVMIVLATLMSFKPAPKAKLYPEIEKFYKGFTIDQIRKEHTIPVQSLSNFILQGIISDKKTTLLFTCENNSFKSLSAQIVLQSLVSVNKINSLIPASVSGGNQITEVNPMLIKILSKHGFIVSELPAENNIKKYEIKFGDGLTPLVVFAKSYDEQLNGKAGFLMISLCAASSACPALANAKFKEALPFDNADASISEPEADKLFTEIASEIVFAFNRANP